MAEMDQSHVHTVGYMMMACKLCLDAVDAVTVLLQYAAGTREAGNDQGAKTVDDLVSIMCVSLTRKAMCGKQAQSRLLSIACHGG